jgi:formylglycine-generating enzyme required for sulfatase activity
VSKSEVTFDEWDACVAYGDCAADIGTAGWGRGSQPVIYVTWNDAQRYVKWLSRVTGRPYRLLTEAEWEYAARSQTTAGTTTHYSFGNDETPLGDYGWFADNADGRAHPVKEKKANPFGLNDMYGNVAEWVEDCFSENYRDARSDGSAWMPANCTRRVIRGGSYQDRAKMLRSASREWATFDKPEKYIGFRVGRTLAAEP